MNRVSNDILMHYGTKRHSGRYPWGSGKDPYQRSGDWLSRVKELKAEGKNDADIAKEFGISSTEYKAAYSIAVNERKLWEWETAKKLKSEGKTDAEIALIIGRPNESSVRSLLKWDPETSGKTSAQITADYLRGAVNDLGVIDVGDGVDRRLNISRERLNQALYILENEGYEVYGGTMDQTADPSRKFVMRVLAPPGTPSNVVYDPSQIKSILEYNQTLYNGGESIRPAFVYPESFDSSRLYIRFPDEGGAEKDGLIEIRPGVEDVSLGESNYAQVRILVDGERYLKGMAVYANDLPPGIDIRFNTSKDRSQGMNALKAIERNPDGTPAENPFGSLIKGAEQGGQRYYDDPNGKYIDPATGKRQSLSVINKRGDEGDWGDWSDAVPSQMLSKQSTKLAQQQLSLAIKESEAEYMDIMSVTNPTLRKDLLWKYAEECDAASVDLKAAAFPRQKYQVLLPVSSLKDNEIYAPNYENGETVALIRYPHGSKSEIPILKVNNKNQEAIDIMTLNPRDAVGINSKVAARMSGADFDGDTVQVIPLSSRANIQSSHPLPGMDGFDPHTAYPERPGMRYMKYEIKDENGRVIKKDNTQKEMGKITNLITDMTIMGADDEEVARAIKHSMVVIDAGKHKLDYKRSELENDIQSLKVKYQGEVNPKTGRMNTPAGTLISRAGSETSVDKTKGAPKINEKGKEWYDPNRPEGALVYKIDTNPKYNKKGEPQQRTQQSTKMAATDDAYTLISKYKTPMEHVYAAYANKMKDMANKARLEYAHVKEKERDPEMARKYSREVEDLKTRLKVSESNQDVERYANVIANARVKARKEADPSLADNKKALGKIRQQELQKAREQVGAKRTKITVSDKEWEAIQNGAISKTMLGKLFKYTDEAEIRQRAMPRQTRELTAGQVALIKTYAESGRTNQELASRFGVSATTIGDILKGKG